VRVLRVHVDTESTTRGCQDQGVWGGGLVWGGGRRMTQRKECVKHMHGHSLIMQGRGKGWDNVTHHMQQCRSEDRMLASYQMMCV
jgi:hypothetical protein